MSTAGRKAKAYKGVVGTILESLDVLVDGAIYFIAAKGVASALPPEVAVGRPFIANGEITLAADDAVYPLAYLDTPFCILKDKSTSATKGTYDGTVDCDEERVYVSDELPSETISLSGNTAFDNEVLQEFESQFNYVVIGDGTGVYTSKEITHTPIWMVLDYTVRGRVAGENIKMKVLPLLPTSLNENANAEAIQDFSIDGQSAGSDALGNKGAIIYDLATA